MILRKTLPVPQTTVDIVKQITAQYFSDKDIVSNTEIGQALKNNGIDYKDYNYPDLTGFLRNFTDVFSIVPVADKKTGKFQINVRILKTGLEQIENKNNMAFKNKLNQIIAEGKYDYVVEPVVLRTVLDINDPEAWELVVLSIAKMEASRFSPIDHITDWEKLVITFDNRIHSAIADADYMIRNGIDENHRIAVQKFLSTYTNTVWNFSTIGLRVEEMCGNDNILALYFYHMGLLAGQSMDRKFCFRNYIVFCAKNYPAHFKNIWNQYKDSYVVNSSMLYILGTLFTAKCYGELIYAYENIPSKVSKTDQLEIYYRYAKAVLGPVTCKELPALNILDEDRGLEVLASYLSCLEKKDNINEYCEMLYLCLSMPEHYVRKAILDNYIAKNTTFISSNFDTLINLAKSGDYRYWLINNYFISNGYVQDTDGFWSAYTQECKALLSQKIADASEEEKQAIIRKAILYFPNDETFSEDSYEVIRSSIYDASIDKVKGICANLFSANNYDILINLYEEKVISDSEAWFLSYVSQCYLAKKDRINASKVKAFEILVQNKLNINSNQTISQLIGMVYDGFISDDVFSINKKDAELFLEIIGNFQPEHSGLIQFHFTVMGLSVVAEKTGLYSVLYSLIAPQDKEAHEEYIQKVEQAILDCNEGYAFRIGEFAKTYEYILTTENIDVINFYTKIIACILKYDGFERDYQKYRNAEADKIDAVSITKLLIVDFDSEKSWRLLSKYSNDCGKYGLNFTANLMWLLKFNEKGHPLTNCKRAVEHWVDDTLPKNFLINSLYLLRRDLHIEGYWQAFYQHIMENNSFSKATAETIDAYFNTISTKSYISNYECSLLISILNQIANVDRYYQLLFNDGSSFEKSLLNDINCLIRFLVRVASEREAVFDFRDKIDSIRNQINFEKLSEKERAAVYWINALFDMKSEGKYDETFFDASRNILANYPLAPANNIISEKVLIKNPEAQINYNLINYWINTFDDIRTVAHTYTYLLRKKRPDGEEERMEAYRLQTTILRKLIIYYDGNESKQIPDYLRVCKTYLAMKALSHDYNSESDAFKRKMYGGFKNKRELNALKSYEVALSNFLQQEIPSYVEKEVLYCGTTNYWDAYLWMMLDKTEDLTISADAIKKYLSVLDRRPLNRRLLQMYLYVNIANLQVLGLGSEKVDAIKNKEIFWLKEEIESGSLIPESYFFNLQNMVNQLCPAIGKVTQSITEVHDTDKKSEYLFVLWFVLSNKNGVI